MLKVQFIKVFLATFMGLSKRKIISQCCFPQAIFHYTHLCATSLLFFKPLGKDNQFPPPFIKYELIHSLPFLY